LFKGKRDLGKSAYVSIFIGGKSGLNVQGECPDTTTRGRRFPVLSPGAEYPSYTPLAILYRMTV